MLLRRFMQHIGRQNWFAVFLDLFIVVFGVWLAFQISEWADGRNRRAELEDQLIALADDLSENVSRLLDHQKYMSSKLAEIHELREILSSEAPQADMDRLEQLLASVFSVRSFQPQVAAYETILTSENVRYLNDTVVRDALNAWQEDLALVKEGESVVLNVRNQVFMKLTIEEYSIAAALERTESVPAETRSSRFRNSFKDLQRNRTLDNMLVLQLATRYTVYQRIGELLESTRAAIEAVDTYMERR